MAEEILKSPKIVANCQSCGSRDEHVTRGTRDHAIMLDTSLIVLSNDTKGLPLGPLVAEQQWSELDANCRFHQI